MFMNVARSRSVVRHIPVAHAQVGDALLNLVYDTYSCCMLYSSTTAVLSSINTSMTMHAWGAESICY